MKNTVLLTLATLAFTPALPAAALFGITSDNHLVSFNSSTPSTFNSSVAVTGLVGVNGSTPDPFATLLNISYNPTQNSLYGIDSNANFYRIASNGVATLVSNGLSPNGFSGGLAYDPFAGSYAFLTDAAENFNLTTAGIVSSNPSLFYGGGDPHNGQAPNIFGLGIDPDFGSAFMVDSVTDTLVRSFSPDLAELFTVGPLGIDVTSFGGLVVDADGNLFATLSTDGLNSALYSINTSTGAATLVGPHGTGIGSIAVPEPSAALLGALGMIGLLRRRRA